MKIRDLPGWPPQWEAYDIGNVAIGEVGLLKGAGSTAVKGELHLLMEHGDALYNGRLMLDEERLNAALATLAAEVGKPIREIAVLELKTPSNLRHGFLSAAAPRNL